MPNAPSTAPIHLLNTRWRIAKQIKNVPQWPGHIEVTKLEYDEATFTGVVHVQAQPSGWTLRLTLVSFYRMLQQDALIPDLEQW